MSIQVLVMFTESFVENVSRVKDKSDSLDNTIGDAGTPKILRKIESMM